MTPPPDNPFQAKPPKDPGTHETREQGIDLGFRTEEAIIATEAVDVGELAIQLEAMRNVEPAQTNEVIGFENVFPSQPPPIPELKGVYIGGYRISRAVASGGMGTVYEAEQQSPRRRVALKVIRTDLSSPDVMRRFKHESHVLGLLHHPGIAQIFEAGTFESPDGPVPFFAMEYIDGLPLTKYIEFKNLDTREILELIAKICDAVEHAHQRGVVHRDLKPENVLVDANGQPRVLDFGVARVAEGDFGNTTAKTRAGVILGTISYMSPEQVSGESEQIDSRSDVYGLGVLTYQALTGELPFNFRGKPLVEAARQIREEEPRPLSSINKMFRGDLETVILKALEKDKDRRYQTAAEFAADLRHYLSDEPIIARPPTTLYQLSKFAKRNRLFVASVAMIFTLLIGGIITIGGYAARLEIQRYEAITAQRQSVESLRVAERARLDAEQRRIEQLAALAEANRERQRAKGNAEQAANALTYHQEVMDDLIRVLAASARDLNGKADPRPSDLIKAARKRITSEFADDPQKAAAMHHHLNEAVAGWVAKRLQGANSSKSDKK